MWVLVPTVRIRTPAWNQTPYEQSWSFGIEHECESILINAEYSARKALTCRSAARRSKLFGAWVESLPIGDFTAATPCQAGQSNRMSQLRGNQSSSPGLISDPNSTIGSSFPQIQYYQLLRPFPHSPAFLQNRTLIANSIYHGLQLTAEKKYSNGLQLLHVCLVEVDRHASAADTNVSWAGSFDSLQDPNKPELERSLSSFDIPYVIQFSYSLRSAGWARASIPG